MNSVYRLHQFDYAGRGKILGRRRSNDGEQQKFFIRTNNEASQADDEDSSEEATESVDESWEEGESDSLDEDCPDSTYTPRTKLVPLIKPKGGPIDPNVLKKGDRAEVLFGGLGWMRGTIHRFYRSTQEWGITFDNDKQLSVVFDSGCWRWAKLACKDPNPIL